MAAARTKQGRRAAAYAAALASAQVAHAGTAQVPGDPTYNRTATGDIIPSVSAAGSRPQGLSGATAVRKLSAAENAKAASLKFGGPLRDRLSIKHAQAREGHRFKLLIREDGTIVHQYGKDVAPELRNVVVNAAKRRATPQLKSGPQVQGKADDRPKRKPPVFHAF
jgi:hypothetical protein